MRVGRGQTLSPPFPQGKGSSHRFSSSFNGTPVLRKRQGEERIPILFRKLHFAEEYFLQLKMNPIRLKLLQTQETNEAEVRVLRKRN